MDDDINLLAEKEETSESGKVQTGLKLDMGVFTMEMESDVDESIVVSTDKGIKKPDKEKTKSDNGDIYESREESSKKDSLVVVDSLGVELKTNTTTKEDNKGKVKKKIANKQYENIDGKEVKDENTKSKLEKKKFQVDEKSQQSVKRKTKNEDIKDKSKPCIDKVKDSNGCKEQKLKFEKKPLKQESDFNHVADGADKAESVHEKTVKGQSNNDQSPEIRKNKEQDDKRFAKINAKANSSVQDCEKEETDNAGSTDNEDPQESNAKAFKDKSDREMDIFCGNDFKLDETNTESDVHDENTEKDRKENNTFSLEESDDEYDIAEQTMYEDPIVQKVRERALAAGPDQSLSGEESDPFDLMEE